MKKARGRYHHGALRIAALAAAAVEIDAHGPLGFTVEGVTRRLGVTPAALYRHFASRDALVGAVLADALARFVEQVDAGARAHAAPRPMMAAALEAYVAFALANPGCYRLLFSRAGMAVFPRDMFGIEPAYPELLRAALGKLLGPRADVDREFLMVWAFVHGTASLLLEGVLADLETTAQRLERAHELIAAYLDRLARRRRS